MDENDMKFDIIMANVDEIIKGQRWITLNGNYTSDQLRQLADNIDKKYNEAINNGTEE